MLGLTPDQLWGFARRGALIAYRARVAAHWEWRVSPGTKAAVDQAPLVPLM